MNHKPNVLCAAPMHFLSHAKEEYGQFLDVKYIFPSTKADIISIISEYDAFIPDPGAKYRVDNEILSIANNLKLIVTPSTGTDHIDLLGCSNRNIVVNSLKEAPDVIENIHASAEFSFVLLMSIIKKFVPAVEAARLGHWREIEDQFRGIELNGKTVGLIGLGRIGRKMAKFCHAFGAKVIATDPFCETPIDYVHLYESQDQLLRESDIVCLHIHLTEDNYDYFSERDFSLMKNGAYFVNTSRGGLLDEEALISSLESGKITAAAVDVIKGEQEKDLSDHKLIRYAAEHDNLIVTPHIAGLTVDSQGKAADYAFHTAKDFFNYG